MRPFGFWLNSEDQCSESFILTKKAASNWTRLFEIELEGERRFSTVVVEQPSQSGKPAKFRQLSVLESG